MYYVQFDKVYDLSRSLYFNAKKSKCINKRVNEKVRIQSIIIITCTFLCYLYVHVLKKFFVQLPSHIVFIVKKFILNCVVFEMDSCTSQASSMGV